MSKNQKVIIWTDAALADVYHLWQFIAGENPVAAQKAVKAIRDSVDLLQRNPDLGRPLPDLADDASELVIPFGRSGYLAAFRPDGNNIVILAVRHQAEAGYSL